MLRKIKLYGELAEFVGHKELEADFKSVGECGRFLVANWPALEGHLKNRFYHVFVDKDNVGEEEVNHFSNGTVKSVPVIQGARKAFKIFAGIALIAVAVCYCDWCFWFKCWCLVCCGKHRCITNNFGY